MSLVDVGRKAPALALNDQNEEKHALKDYLGKPVSCISIRRTTPPAVRRKHVSFVMISSNSNAPRPWFWV